MPAAADSVKAAELPCCHSRRSLAGDRLAAQQRASAGSRSIPFGAPLHRAPRRPLTLKYGTDRSRSTAAKCAPPSLLLPFPAAAKDACLYRPAALACVTLRPPLRRFRPRRDTPASDCERPGLGATDLLYPLLLR